MTADWGWYRCRWCWRVKAPDWMAWRVRSVSWEGKRSPPRGKDLVSQWSLGVLTKQKEDSWPTPWATARGSSGLLDRRLGMTLLSYESGGIKRGK